jgi:uncharacterized protein (TIGR03382 family)
VILQDQSQVPGFPQTEPEWQASYDGAIVLDGLADTAGAETLFFLTWGRREGDLQNPNLFPDFPTMQAALTGGYVAYRDATSTGDRPTWIAPVGPAFALVYDDVVAGGGDPLDPSSRFWRLYVDDGSHPSALGTYLAACVFYDAITGEACAGREATTVDPLDAEWLQEAADAVVFDDSLGFTYPWTPVPPPDDDTDAGDGSSSDGAAPCGCATGGGASAASVVALAWMVRRRRRIAR